MSRRARFRFVVAVAIVLVAVAIPSWLHSRDLTARLACGSNMKGIATALKVYSGDWSLDDPDPIAMLIAKGEIPASAGHCPASGKPYRINRAYFTAPHAQNSSTTVVVFEELANHDGIGANMCYSDGHASFEKAGDVQRILVAQRISE